MADKLISPIHFKSVSFVTASPEFALGTERVVDGEKYQYVFNAAASTATAGLGLRRATGAGPFSGTISSVSGDGCIGFVKHVDIPSEEYGWALKRGQVTVAVASGNSTIVTGPVGLGANGVIATLSAGGLGVGEISTTIVSGNSGSLHVMLP